MSEIISGEIRNKSRQGFSLLEVIIYIALLGGISVFITNFLMQTVNTYQRARAEREVLENGRLMLESIGQSIGQAQEVYYPSSRFLDDAGQLSLVTQAGASAEHPLVFVDFWLDNGRVWFKQEGSGSIPISAASVRVSKFNFERIAQGLNHESIKTTIQVDAAGVLPASIILNTTMSLRGGY